MPQIASRNIQRMLIVDDDPLVRGSYGDTILDCGMEPVPENGPIDSLAGYVAKTVANGVQAAVCDYHLRKHAYSVVDGAQLIAELYSKGFPALLCTRWAGAEQDDIRLHRRRIPVLLGFEQLDPDSIADGLYRCVREIEGHLVPSRKPWRTLVRIEEVDDTTKRLFVFVPGWDPNTALSLPFHLVPTPVLDAAHGGVLRLFADVNIGAESAIDLYFENWVLA